MRRGVCVYFFLMRLPSGPAWDRLRARAPAQGNDIVLCDGCCSRAYHERCVVPRLVAAELSEEDGWLCPACDAKARARACLSVARRCTHALRVARRPAGRPRRRGRPPLGRAT
jgi:hypothetical protein